MLSYTGLFESASKTIFTLMHSLGLFMWKVCVKSVRKLKKFRVNLSDIYFRISVSTSPELRCISVLFSNFYNPGIRRKAIVGQLWTNISLQKLPKIRGKDDRTLSCLKSRKISWVGYNIDKQSYKSLATWRNLLVMKSLWIQLKNTFITYPFPYICFDSTKVQLHQCAFFQLWSSRYSQKSYCRSTVDKY